MGFPGELYEAPLLRICGRMWAKTLRIISENHYESTDACAKALGLVADRPLLLLWLIACRLFPSVPRSLLPSEKLKVPVSPQDIILLGI